MTLSKSLKKALLYTLISVIVFNLSELGAQIKRIHAKKMDVFDGMAHNSILSIVQDSLGFIWFGTTNGLSRYDGYNLKNYQASPIDSNTIYNNRIQLLFVDRQGELWISVFDTVICKYNYEKDNFTRFNESSVSKEVRDSTNRFINKTQKRAVFNKQEFEIREGVDLIHRNNITGAEIIYEGGIPPYKEKQDFNCLFIDRNNVLWIGTNYSGVLRVDLLSNEFTAQNNIIQPQEEPVSSSIRTFMSDGKDLWMGTFYDGFSVLDRESGNRKHYYPYLNSGDWLSSGKVRAIYKDHTGDVWLGYNPGVDKVDHLSGKVIPYSIRPRYMSRYPNGGWGRVKRLPRTLYFTIYEDDRHNLWIGSQNGIFRYDREQDDFLFYPLEKEFKNSIATCMTSDSNGHLWIGTEMGGVVNIRRDKNQEQWIDTINYRFRVGDPSSLPDDRVTSIVEDQMGHIWVGTENGLCKIEPQQQRVETFSMEEGLSDPGIASLVIDVNNKLWISHKKGISSIELSSMSIKNYSIDEINEGGRFLNSAGCYDALYNTVYFGYTGGYISFQPEHIKDNPFAPVVRIVQLKILNKPVEVNKEVNGRVVLDKSIYHTSKIVLTHKDRDFSIEFAALHYNNPDLNKFSYMLEGFDDEWINTDARHRVATYSNLKPGSYTFKVKASNGSDLWSEKEAGLVIKVLPPWWNTWKAYVLYALVLTILAYLVLKTVLTKQQYEYLLSIEKLKAEKIQEVAQMKNRFFTNVSHEIRTPLTLILAPIEELMSLPNNENQHYFKIIKRNADRLLNLVNQLLDVRKMEEGKMTLYKTRSNIVELLFKAVESFKIKTETQQLKIQFTTSFEQLDMMLDVDKMNSVFYNLISNAVKYSNVDGSIEIKIGQKGEKGDVYIEISNEGKEITKDEIDKIFSPFYRSDSSGKKTIPGTGLGLVIVKQFVELHKGQVDVVSKDGVITFRISLPTETIIEKVKSSGDKFILATAESGKNVSSHERVSPVENGSENDKHVLLIVDDEEDVVEFLYEELKSQYHILKAANGEEGIQKTLNVIPDLVISDVMMPEMDGMEFCKRLKSDVRTCYIPVMLLTAKHAAEDMAEGYELNADAYMTKPFQMNVLKARIKNLIQSREMLRGAYQSQDNTTVIQYENKDSDDQLFINAITDRIKNQEGEYSVEKLADYMEMNRTQLYRRIKSITGQSANAFISEIRFSHAVELLMEGKRNISEIAYVLGYSEPGNFSRSFYRRFGVSPSKYIEIHKP